MITNNEIIKNSDQRFGKANGLEKLAHYNT